MPHAIVDADLLQIPAGPGSLHVERYGLGQQSIVLLPAFGTSAFLWRSVAPRLAELGYAAFAVDPMGYGESDRPLDGDYSIAAQTDYVRTALGAMRIESATVVGVEAGAALALRLAATVPSLVSHLVLVSPVWKEPHWPSPEIRRLQKATARNAVRLARGVLGATFLLEPLLKGAVSDERHMPPRLVARYLAPFTGTEGAVHLLDLARAFHEDDLEDVDPRRIACPTLIVTGEEDSAEEAVARELHESIDESVLSRIPSAGRLVPEDAPEKLTSTIVEFLRNRAASADSASSGTNRDRGVPAVAGSG